MADSKFFTNWEKGANNVVQADRLPDGYARAVVNADPCPGGPLNLRTGYERVYQGTNVRGVLALGDNLLIADGASLVEFNGVTGATRALRAIAGAGPFVGDYVDNVLYFCTATECLQYDGHTVRNWGVPDVSNQPSISVGAGGLQAGGYQVAMTYTDAYGVEGGTDAPAVVNVPANGAVVVNVQNIPAGCKANVYIGSVNGSTLYLQATMDSPAAMTFGLLRDDTQRCTTILCQAPIPGTQVTAHRGVLAVANDNVLQLTLPFQRHLISRHTGFVQFGGAIGMVVHSEDVKPGHLFVSADRCYVLTDAETDRIGQQPVLQYPAVAGTGVRLPDGRGAWMTQYGQAITRGAEVSLVNRESFAPILAASGAAGVVDFNGNQMVVTTMRGPNRPNLLAATDFFEGEILNP